MGEPCVIAGQSFESQPDEFILGLGQFQDGHFNLKDVTRKLTQVNTQISIPFIYSNKGYGLLWHQYGLTDFNPADSIIPIEKQNIVAEKSEALVDAVAMLAFGCLGLASVDKIWGKKDDKKTEE
jgi:alpha-D-xyloside xylohydrolase